MYVCCFVADEIISIYDETHTNSLDKAIQYAKDIYNDLCDTFCFDGSLNVKICVLDKLTLGYVYTLNF